MRKKIFVSILPKIFFSAMSIFLGSFFFSLLLMVMFSFSQSLQKNSAQSIGGDIKLSKNFAFTPEENNFFETLSTDFSTQTLSQLDFSAMVIGPRTEILTNVTVVGKNYPLYGNVQMKEGEYAPLLEDQILLDISFFDQGWKKGEMISLGNATFVIEGFFETTPNIPSGVSFFGSRAILSLEGFERSGIEKDKNRIKYTFLFKSLGDFEPLKNTIQEYFSKRREIQVASFDENDGTAGRIFQQIEKFFLIFLAAVVLLFSTTFFWGVYGYIREQTKTIGVLQSLGTLSSQLVSLYAIPSAFIFLVLGALGVLLSLMVFFLTAPLLSEITGFDLFFDTKSIWYALCFVGILALSAFGGVSFFCSHSSEKILLGSEQIVGSSLQKKFFFLFGVFAFFFWIFLGEISNSYWFPLVFFGSVLLLFGCIALVLKGIFLFFKAIRFSFGFYTRIIIQWITEKGIKKFFIVSVFFSLFFVIASISFLQKSFLKSFVTLSLEDAPQAFFLDITADQKDSLAQILEKNGEAQIFSTTRGRISQINERNITQDTQGQITRSFTILFSDELLSSDELLEGEIWKKGETKNSISLEESIATSQGIKLGDTLVFSLLGRDIPFEVVAIRKVEKQDLSPWFVFTIPENTLASLPRTSLGFWWGDEKILQKMKSQIARSFPNISVIETKNIRESVSQIVESFAVGIFWISLFLVFSSSIVLFYFLSEYIFVRKKNQNTLFKLGMKNKMLKKLFFVELFVLLTLPFVFAVMLATLTIWCLLYFFLDIAEFSFSFLPVLVFVIFLFFALFFILLKKDSKNV